MRLALAVDVLKEKQPRTTRHQYLYVRLRSCHDDACVFLKVSVGHDSTFAMCTSYQPQLESPSPGPPNRPVSWAGTLPRTTRQRRSHLGNGLCKLSLRLGRDVHAIIPDAAAATACYCYVCRVGNSQTAEGHPNKGHDARGNYEGY